MRFKLVSSVNIYKTKDNGIIDLEIELFDLPELSELSITGVKKKN